MKNIAAFARHQKCLLPRLAKAARVYGLISSMLAVSVLALGCQNVYSSFADKSSDSALSYQAQQQIDASNYNAAISTIQSMSASGLAARATQDLLASAYAGSCGLNLLGLSTALSNMGTSTLFQALLTEYKAGITANVASCQSAETVLGALSSRTADENLLLSFVELAKIGRILSLDADLNQDGFVDTGYNPCNLSVPDATAIGVGITTFLTALSASGVSVGSSATASLTSTCTAIDTEIAALPGQTGFSGFCSLTTFNSTELQVIRSLTSSNEIGLATCNNSFQNCLCQPFP